MAIPQDAYFLPTPNFEIPKRFYHLKNRQIVASAPSTNSHTRSFWAENGKRKHKMHLKNRKSWHLRYNIDNLWDTSLTLRPVWYKLLFLFEDKTINVISVVWQIGKLHLNSLWMAHVFCKSVSLQSRVANV